MQCVSGQEKSAPVLCESILDPELEEMIGKAFQQLKEGSFEDAKESFAHYLQLEPNVGKAYYGRAMASFQLKEWASAVEDFQKSKDLDPENLDGWIGLGMSLAMVNKIYEAEDVFTELLARHPEYVRGHIQLGQLYYRLGLIPKGHAQMEAGIKARPTLAERQLIERLLKEQKALDKKRYYRPDFEALSKENERTAANSWLRKFFAFLNQKFRKPS